MEPAIAVEMTSYQEILLCLIEGRRHLRCGCLKHSQVIELVSSQGRFYVIFFN